MSDNLQKKFGYDYFHGRGSSYPACGYEMSDFSYLENYVGFLISIKRRRVHGIRWLDVGCAYGFLVYIANKHGIDCYGADCSEYAITMGKKLYPSVQSKLFVCECDKVLEQFGEHSFDVISLLSVVEHLPTPVQSLSIVSKCLKPHGLLLLSTPAYERAKQEDITHISIKPLAEWVRILRALGLSVKAPYAIVDPTKSDFHPVVRFFGHCPPFAELYRRLKRRHVLREHSTQILAKS